MECLLLCAMVLMTGCGETLGCREFTSEMQEKGFEVSVMSVAEDSYLAAKNTKYYIYQYTSTERAKELYNWSLSVSSEGQLVENESEEECYIAQDDIEIFYYKYDKMELAKKFFAMGRESLTDEERYKVAVVIRQETEADAEIFIVQYEDEESSNTRYGAIVRQGKAIISGELNERGKRIFEEEFWDE